MKRATNTSFVFFALVVIVVSMIGCGTTSRASSGKAVLDGRSSENASAPENAESGFTEADAYALFDNSAERISIAEVPAFVADDVLNVDLSELTIAEGSNPAMRIPDSNHKLSVCSNHLNVFQTDGQICFKGDEVGDEANREYKGNLQINLMGTASKGVYVSVKKTARIKIVLTGCTINSGNYPCIMNDGRAELHIDVLDGTANHLNDGRRFATGYSEYEGLEFYSPSFSGSKVGKAKQTVRWAKGDNSKGTLFTKGNLYFTGKGVLNVNESYKHAIVSSKGFVRLLDKTTINIKSRGRNGFHVANGFVMDDGIVTINGLGEYKDNESKGIVVEGYDEEAVGHNAGFIVIKGGKLDLYTVSKAITAKWDPSEDRSKTGRSNGWEPSPFVLITGGDIKIKTIGTPYESASSQTVISPDGVSQIKNGVSLSPEGIEGKGNLYIYGGDIACETTDDCIGVSSENGVLEIGGGTIRVHSISNDCIDSNGKIRISGGTIVAYSAANPEYAFDCDQNEFSITGGTLIGIGTSKYSKPWPEKCSQGVIALSGNSLPKAGEVLAVMGSDGSVKFACKMPVATRPDFIAILSSPELKKDGTYSVISGVSAEGGETFNEIWTEMPSIAGGRTVESGISFSDSFVHVQKSVKSNDFQSAIRPISPGLGGVGGKSPI